MDEEKRVRQYEKHEEEFSEYIRELKESYNENPEFTAKFVKESSKKFKKFKMNPSRYNFNDIKEDDKEKLSMIFTFLFLAIIGLANIGAYPMYLFGIVFFVAGFCVSMFSGEAMTIIFLFSHGVTGYCLMAGSLLYEMFQDPIMGDGAENVRIVFIIGVVIAIVAVIYAVLYSMSKNLREAKNSKLIPLALFTLGMIIFALLSVYYKDIYDFNLLRFLGK